MTSVCCWAWTTGSWPTSAFHAATCRASAPSKRVRQTFDVQPGLSSRHVQGCWDVSSLGSLLTPLYRSDVGPHPWLLGSERWVAVIGLLVASSALVSLVFCGVGWSTTHDFFMGWAYLTMAGLPLTPLLHRKVRPLFWQACDDVSSEIQTSHTSRQGLAS